MDPFRRSLVAISATLVVLAVALVFRMLIASGVFSDVKTGFAGACIAVAGIIGAEDIAIDERDRIAFVSATDRVAKGRGRPAAQDGLYMMALGSDVLKKLSGTPDDFHPHGISLYRAPDGSLTLMAINHQMDGTHSVDIFDVTVSGGAVTLHEVGSIEGGLMISPNAVAAVNKDRFYVTNDHTSRTPLGRWLDDNFVVPRADVLYFDGSSFRIVAEGLNFPSGIALSHDGAHVYVSESYNRQLDTYERNPFFGSLERVNVLAIPSNLDNSRVDADGNVWIASHPKAFAMAKFRSDPSQPAPSEIFKVATLGGIPQSAVPIYGDMGKGIGASSVAAVFGKTLLIGSPFDKKILDCTLP